jgi:hypothetical protein
MEFNAVYSGSGSGDTESPEYTPSIEGDKPMISLRNRGRSWTGWPLIALLLAGAVPDLAAETLGQEEARQLVDEIVPRVEELRGLKFKQPVSVEVVGAAEIREYVLARMKKFEQEQHLLAVQRAYALLGLLPEGIDLLAMLLQVMEEQAGGYYDPSTKAYYLMDNVEPDLHRARADARARGPVLRSGPAARAGPRQRRPSAGAERGPRGHGDGADGCLRGGRRDAR